MTVVARGGFRQLSVVTDRDAEQVDMGGGITNLLRMARNECRGLVAFVAAAKDGGLEVASFPAGGDEQAGGTEAVAQLVRLTSSDPEFGHGGPFVRTVILDGFLEPVTVAVAPLGIGGDRGLLGVVGHEPSAFGEHQRRFLERVAQRLSRHLQARQEIEHRHRVSPVGKPSPADLAPSPPGVFSSPPPEHEIGAAEGVTGPVETSRSTEPVVPPWAEAPPLGLAGPARTAPHPAGRPRAVVPPVRWSVVEPPVERPETDRPGEDDPASASAPAANHEHAPAPPGTPDLFSPAWEEADEVTGLPGLGSFFSRTGRVMGGGEPKAVAMVVVEVREAVRPEELVAQLVAGTLRSQLRATDPLARIGRSSFAAAVVLEPGTTLAPSIEQRLAGAVRTALTGGTARAVVQSVHVLAEPEQKLDADELLRRSVRLLEGG